ncbi:MAG: glycosyl transferase [Enterovirga sp.]|nr:glycosyl transferase [Enterovirga sp.]
MVRRNGDIAFSPRGLTAEPGSYVSLGAGRRKPLLLCLSHLRWDFVWQRPQHLLSRAARDFNVVVFEEPMWRAGVSPHLEVTRRDGGIRIAVPILPEGMYGFDATTEQRRMLERFLAAEPAPSRIFWYYTPMAMSFSGHLPADAVIYDNMDELSAFCGASPEMLANEEDLFARADLVFTGGMSLYEAKRHRHPSVHPFPSSIDAAHFARARTERRDPADQAAIPGPRLGFFGVIDERMDIELVGAVADARPDWQFVMIGPVVKIDPASLPQRPNIHWLGGKRYEELPSYLSGWDIGFMPFALNDATRFISPTKTPEFLAAGVPVVSTPITDVIRPYGQRNLVEIAADAGEVVAAAERLMARPRAPWLQRVDRHLATGSWDATWAAMRRLIGDAMGEPDDLAVASGAAASTIAAGPAE